MRPGAHEPERSRSSPADQQHGPSPLFLHDRGRFQGTPGDSRGLNQRRQLQGLERLTSKVVRHQAVRGLCLSGSESLHRHCCFATVSLLQSRRKAASRIRSIWPQRRARVPFLLPTQELIHHRTKAKVVHDTANVYTTCGLSRPCARGSASREPCRPAPVATDGEPDGPCGAGHGT
jgi:hypothetical protein